MAKRSAAERPKTAPRSGALLAAAALALAAGLWSGFLWLELLDARSGGEAFCVFGEGESCAAAWDGPLASAVQSRTGLPVAAWGVVWALAALVLTLGAWWRRRAGASPEPFASATALTALGGVVAVVALAASLLGGGPFCSSCLVTHGFVLAYAAVVFAAGGRLGQPGSGIALAAGAVAAAFALMLFPGLQTPAASARGGLGATASANGALAEWVDGLDDEVAQALSDALADYRRSPRLPAPAPRSLVLGPPDAPVRITEFADILCSHCASFHGMLAQLQRVAPPGSFNVEPRYFPLDGACNPTLRNPSRDPVRCTAAKALICVAGHPRSFEAASELFARQRSLDVAAIHSAVEPYLGRERLERCLEAPETEAALLEDVAWATRLEIQGTPLVLVNGRKAATFPTLLYALVLAEGNAEHPAFSRLPDPKPKRRGG